MHKDSKYVLFLDDDVRLHPGSIGALTAEMEKTPEVLMLENLNVFNVILRYCEYIYSICFGCMLLTVMTYGYECIS